MAQLVINGNMSREKFVKCFEAWLAHATGEPAEYRKGTPFICRTDNHFMVENMKRYYKSLLEVIDNGT